MSMIIRISYISMMMVAMLPTAVHADGFGWYPRLFDYESFAKNYQNIKNDIKLIEIDFEGEDATRYQRKTDWPILEYLGENEKTYQVEYSESDSGDLLWHEALMEISDVLLKTYPNSPVQYFRTGRLFLSPSSIIPCAPEQYGLIHGACRTCIIFSNLEVASVSEQMNTLKSSGVKFSESDILLEFNRLRAIFSEAARKNKGLYLYGHD